MDKFKLSKYFGSVYERGSKLLSHHLPIDPFSHLTIVIYKTGKFFKFSINIFPL